MSFFELKILHLGAVFFYIGLLASVAYSQNTVVKKVLTIFCIIIVSVSGYSLLDRFGISNLSNLPTWVMAKVAISAIMLIAPAIISLIPISSFKKIILYIIILLASFAYYLTLYKPL